jgi:hypothetical protein
MDVTGIEAKVIEVQIEETPCQIVDQNDCRAESAFRTPARAEHDEHCRQSGGGAAQD